MEIVESFHWKKKKKYRQDIENYMIDYAITHCKRMQRDKHYKNALNAIALIPQTGKKLKIVFRRIGEQRIKLITAYYID